MSFLNKMTLKNAHPAGHVKRNSDENRKDSDYGKKTDMGRYEKKYPDEWLLIADFELDSSGHIVSGVVERHSKEKGDVYRLPALGRSSAFRYTGESDFSDYRAVY